MDFALNTWTLAEASREKADALLLLVSDDFIAGSDPLSILAALALKNKDWQSACGKTLELYQPPTIAARRVTLVGIGAGRAKDVQKALQACVAALKNDGLQRALLCFASAPATGAVAAAVQTVAQISYTYTHTKPEAKPWALQHVHIATPPGCALQEEFDRALALALGVGLAREWANRPANHATPTLLAEAAQALAKLKGIRCTVHGPEEVQKLGMGAFLAVAQGSAQPLRLIELRYNGAGKKDAPIVLVGKGITFDSGGISIKPAAEMDEMKFDMGGAASVLGVFRALAALQPSINVVGLIPAAENMPSGTAVKPGDVVTSMSGQTIEILNTDAEGRLVLCDALTYAQRFAPAAIIDIATLTGACVIALGGVRSGLFASCDALAQSLQTAGEAALDPCWRMPLDEDYADGLKSHFADVANVAGRPAGAVTAAKFLQRFVDQTPWAHLDIAGTAWKSGAAKGATGRPVGLLVHYLMGQAAQAAQKPAPEAGGKRGKGAPSKA